MQASQPASHPVSQSVCCEAVRSALGRLHVKQRVVTTSKVGLQVAGMEINVLLCAVELSLLSPFVLTFSATKLVQEQKSMSCTFVMPSHFHSPTPAVAQPCLARGLS